MGEEYSNLTAPQYIFVFDMDDMDDMELSLHIRIPKLKKLGTASRSRTVANAEHVFFDLQKDVESLDGFLHLGSHLSIFVKLQKCSRC